MLVFIFLQQRSREEKQDSERYRQGAFNKLSWMQVRLIGYCTEGSLFLVYEFVDNGNLSQHLRGTGKSL